ncbi:PucR family transcriptional regulator [Streptomyces sp. 8N706]|uniref:PucR family transcriptional regulator n=1 Tax=Streptomyces sp. 8N706 TaxID=3457416 RepID=UPI003FD16098
MTPTHMARNSPSHHRGEGDHPGPREGDDRAGRRPADAAPVSGEDGPRTPETRRGGARRVPQEGDASDPQDLYALSRAMFAATEEAAILHLALAGVNGFDACTGEAGYLVVDGRLTRVPAEDDSSGSETDLDRQVRELGGRDGPVALSPRVWSRAYALRCLSGFFGYLVVRCATRPSRDAQDLLAVLVQQTAAALSSAAAHRREDEAAVELERRRDELEATHLRLDSSLSELEYQQNVHESLDRVAADQGGQAGIVRVLHEVTGLPAVIEDRFGNLRAWAGPGRPDPYPKSDAVRREEMLQNAARRPMPVRVRRRLITLVKPGGEVLGVLALVDPDGRADERTVFALQHAAASLALELVHLRSLAEVELRLRRDLVDDLLAGTDEVSAYVRSEAVGHDLHGPQYVLAVQWPGRKTDDSFVQTVDRSAFAVGMRSLLVRRSDAVVLISQGKPRGTALYDVLARETGTTAGAIGVGGRCDSPARVPRSYQEALRALEIRRQSRRSSGMTFFDDLGLYRLLGPRNDSEEVEAFAREWLGPLLDYDAQHHTDLVETLSQYFECGGNYDTTASVLAIHRSTLRYRLQRIRKIGGLDLSDVDSRLNLHVATRVWRVLSGATAA